MSDLICIKCDKSKFLDPEKDICYKTGGLFCTVLEEIVGKYEPCRAHKAKDGKTAVKKKQQGGAP